MNEASVQSVNAYWSAMFGCRITELRPARGLAFTHAGFTGYDGTYAMMFDSAAPIVSVSSDVFVRAGEDARAWHPGSIRDALQVAAMLGDRAGQIIGPRYCTPMHRRCTQARLRTRCEDCRVTPTLTANA